MRNPQRIQRSSRRARAPKQARQYHSKKVMVESIEFDSATEAAFYQKLKRDLSVELIEVQPEFQIIKPFSFNSNTAAFASRSAQ